MNKVETLEKLANAKKAHIKWVNRAKSLIEGIPVEKEAIPLDSTECAFGQWFYGEGQKLNALTNAECLNDIESLHFKLHDMYLKIFKIYFGETNRSLLGRLFKSKKKVSEAEKGISREYFDELQGISRELLAEISKLERRLHAMPQSTMDGLSA